VLALHAAVNRAMPHVKDDPELVDQALRDCREILEVVLEGKRLGVARRLVNIVICAKVVPVSSVTLGSTRPPGGW